MTFDENLMWETQLCSKIDKIPFKFNIIEWHMLMEIFTTQNLSQVMV